MNSTNNNGPKMEPCGTPDKTVILSEAIFSRTTLYFLPCRWFTRSFRRLPSIPYCNLSLLKIKSCETVSKAFAKSKYTASTPVLSCSEDAIEFVNVSKFCVA